MTNTPIKDHGEYHPVASEWHTTLKSIVDAFVAGDYGLQCGPPRVLSPSVSDSDYLRSAVDAYGESLCPLPDESWNSSVMYWAVHHWVVIVDLWTVEAGRSDMVMECFVRESDDGYTFEVSSIYVP